jgi:hypothetical protein
MWKSLLPVALVVWMSPVSAQDVSDVKFKPGDFGAMVNGTIIGDGYVEYRLGAKAGQELYVELVVEASNGSGTVYFNGLPPGSSGEAIYNSSIDGNTTTVDLPASGTYAIRVYHMGNDEDSGATSSFRMDLSIQ